MTPDFVKEYVSNLLVSAGLTDMPADFKEQYTNQVIQEVERRIGLVVLGELNPQAAEALTQLSESNAGPSATADWLQNHSQNYEAKIAQALDQFKADFLSSLGAIKQSVKAAAKAS